MTVGPYHHHQQQSSQQHQQQNHFMVQNARNFAMNLFASNQNQAHAMHLMDTKGLLNGPGQNNCFLNCAVQVSPLNYQYFQFFYSPFFCYEPCGIN